jgi:hypothetical protein
MKNQNRNANNEEADDMEENIEGEDEEEEDDDDQGTDEEEEGVIDLNLDMDRIENMADNIQTESNPLSTNIRSNFNKNELVLESESRFDHIKDPNVRKLMAVDLEASSKDEIVNMLMQNEALDKKLNPSKKKIRGKKSYKVQSNYNIERLNSENNKTSNFQLAPSKDNPELTTDFSTAVKKLLSKMSKDTSCNPELLKILIPDKYKANTEIEKLDIVRPEHIDNKVKGYLSNKQKKLNGIADKMNEEFTQKYTFSPELITNEGKSQNSLQKRKFDQFINDQYSHNKKVQDKVKMATEENRRKEDELMKESYPKINENSEKIFEGKFKTEESAHLRLYNKRYQSAKKEALGILTGEDGININSPDKKKKGNKLDDVLNKNQKEKKQISKREADEYMSNKLYKDAIVQSEKIEKIKKKILSEEVKGKENNIPDVGSNKLFLQSIMDKYKKAINEVISSSMSLNRRDNNILSDNEEEYNNNQLNRLNLIQVNEVLFKLGFTQNVDNKDTAGSESLHRQNEKKLVGEVFEALKDSEAFVNVDHLFIFILAIINLYEYYLYSSYKKSPQERRKEEPVKEANNYVNMKNKSKQLQKVKLDKLEVIAKINSDINNKIVNQTKYGAFDESNNFLIPLDNAKVINRDFKIFCVNFMNVKTSNKNKKDKKDSTTTITFKPQINENSNKLSEEFRKKILTDLNNSEDNSGNNAKKDKDKTHLEYIDKLIMKRKKKE